MNKIHSITSIFLLLIFSGCEEVSVTYPGNNQDLSSKAPKGDIIWDESTIKNVDEEGRGLLPENSAPGITIGRLNATDENPDDEFHYEIKPQDASNYFRIAKDGSNYDLETNTSIDYESLAGSKNFTITITVSDDNPDQKTSNFDVVIKITNVNESPFWANASGVKQANYQPSIVADIEIPFTGTLHWDDEDNDQTPELTISTEKPDWLTIDINGKTATMSGTPDWGNNDVGTGSFLLTISDGEFEVPVDMNFEVRPNQRPYLQSFSPTHSFRVGCNQISDEILTYIAKDPDNVPNNFNGGNEFDLLTVDYDEDIGWLAIDLTDNITETPSLVLRCVSTPTNNDAQDGAQQITFSIADNREVIPQDTTYQLTMIIEENHEPQFINSDQLPATIPSNETFTWTVQWEDVDDDQIKLIIDNPPSWISYDQSTGFVSANTTSVQAGEYGLLYTIHEDNDGCYSQSFTHTITVE